MGRTAVKQVSPNYYADFLELVAQGYSNTDALLELIKETGQTFAAASSDLYRKLYKDENFCNEYARAKKNSSYVDLTYIEDLKKAQPERCEDGRIDPSWVQLQRLLVDSKKWAMGKKHPKYFGESSQIEHSGNLSVTLTPKFADRGDDDGER